MATASVKTAAAKAQKFRDAIPNLHRQINTAITAAVAVAAAAAAVAAVAAVAVAVAEPQAWPGQHRFVAALLR